jgi:hypothetical protein
VAKELEEKIQGSISLSLSTFKTLFKNNEEKHQYNIQLQREIDRLHNEEVACSKLSFVTDYYLLAQANQFKALKLDEFARVVRDMSTTEIDNSNTTAEFWSNLLSSHPNLKLSNN